jgi:WD40 repeat protein
LSVKTARKSEIRDAKSETRVPKSEANPKTEPEIRAPIPLPPFRCWFSWRIALPLLVLLMSHQWIGLAETAATPPAAQDYAIVDQILSKHCLDCHGSQEPEAKLVLESFDDLMKGGESGPAILPAKSSESLLIQMVEGRVERGGKQKIMPPGKRSKLSTAEIAALKAWIDAGAHGPVGHAVVARTLAVPKIIPSVPPRRPIHALAYASSPRLIALGRDGEVEVISSETHAPFRTLSGQRGSVNALVFSKDGQDLFAAGGEAGLLGEVRQWHVADGSLVRTFQGHKDAIYSVALSPDGQIMATGSYDQKIKLWNTQTGTEIRTLSGHNGAIFDLAFRPDGRILASGSADRTVKLWEIATGERRDTLSQSLKEIYTLAFSPNGERLLAAGADNRIRIWSISPDALETTNPILESRFAHEGAILKIAFSADGKMLISSASDQTVKLWDSTNLTERLALERQPDWAPALTFASEDRAVVVGRLDGTLQFYDTTQGHVLAPPPPQLARLEPRGLQRGTSARLKLVGSNLIALTEVKFSDARLKAESISSLDAKGEEASLTVTSAPDLPRGTYELWVRNANGESRKLKLFIDDLPQIYLDPSASNSNRVQTLANLPVSVWGIHEKPGDWEELGFSATRGQSLVFDVAAQSLGSKADVVLTLSDAQGGVLASSNGFDRSRDPLLFYTFRESGEYRIRVNELVLGGSLDHYYRLSIGSFPCVTGCFPLSVPARRRSVVELIGYNLPCEHTLAINAEGAGEITLPINNEQFRTRGEIKLIASELAELLEVEPNDTPAEATPIVPPCAVGGRIFAASGSSDVDCYRFAAKAGQKWVIETMAAQRGSPVDTKIEILHPDGRPVERCQLQAVRDSAVTFRGIDSDTTDCRVVNWEEMELNQYLYLQGEVVKLFRAPQGPDSGFLFYSSNGKRRCYFDTSPSAHAVDEPCYTVEPRPPGAKLVSTGLPVFPVYFANDDDAERRLGTDSRVHFTPPSDGVYVVRVTDTRGFNGERLAYRLVVRPAEPDFNVSLSGANLTVNAGSGQSFSLAAERKDEFEGEISVSFDHLPPAFTVSSPLVIESGHTEASGTLHAALDAPKPTEADWAKVQVTATAQVDGQAFVKAVNTFGPVKLTDPPKLFVSLEPDPVSSRSPALTTVSTNSGNGLLEMTLAPGQTIPAWLRVRRNGLDDLITFTVEDLPHGVIVDNIGLNGVLIPKGQNERQIFLTAAKWVPETDRLCYAVESQAGRQTSLPVWLHVRRQTHRQAAAR